MIERSFCADDMSGLLSVNAQQMSSFQNTYSNGGHFSSMYPQNQRPSFAIQELLGLGNTSCRQNMSPDLMETQGGMASGNLMYFSRDLPMYNHCNFNTTPQLHHNHQEPMGQSYVNVNVRDSVTSQHQSNAGSTFCPWRVEPLGQTTVNNQQHLHHMMPKPTDTATYNYKMSPIMENEGKIYK